MKQFIPIILSISFLASGLVSSYSEFYQQYDGTYITEQEYIERLNICANEIQKGNLDPNSTDCLQWALTQNAQSQKAFNDLTSRTLNSLFK